MRSSNSAWVALWYRRCTASGRTTCVMSSLSSPRLSSANPTQQMRRSCKTLATPCGCAWTMASGITPGGTLVPCSPTAVPAVECKTAKGLGRILGSCSLVTRPCLSQLLLCETGVAYCCSKPMQTYFLTATNARPDPQSHQANRCGQDTLRRFKILARCFLGRLADCFIPSCLL